ncbi:hypothetical protein, partial [Pseudomonas parasichuanensis]|uniref:hypothetical protein n=1 Tax=Pseudomonas parasichuanensis TaxID=2892329 RepID=UPI001F30F7C6
HHFHTDHPVFSCSKIEQKQLNTWVSFQSAEQPLLGQFSVSGNTQSLASFYFFTIKATKTIQFLFRAILPAVAVQQCGQYALSAVG